MFATAFAETVNQLGFCFVPSCCLRISICHYIPFASLYYQTSEVGLDGESHFYSLDSPVDSVARRP